MTGKKRNKKDTSKECKTGEGKRLKSVIRTLKRENEQLRSQVRELRKALKQNCEYVHKKVQDINVLDVINSEKLDDILDSCPECHSRDVNVTKGPFGTMIKCNRCGSVNVNKDQ